MMLKVSKEVAMIICAFVSIVFLGIAFLPPVVEDQFSAEELARMGVNLEGDAPETVHSA